MTLPSHRDRFSFLIPVIFRVIASCTLVSIWLIQFFLQPLRHDAIIMVRRFLCRSIIYDSNNLWLTDLPEFCTQLLARCHRNVARATIRSD
jgi:hypothetical protein